MNNSANSSRARSGATPAKRGSAELRSTRHPRWRKWLIVLVVFGLLAGAGRAVLPWIAEKTVNHVLNRSLLYTGRVGHIGVHLLRGAYSVEDVELNKTTGSIAVPFFAAKRVDFSIEWGALLRGRVVSSISVQQPEVNIVQGPTAAQSQTGNGLDVWIQILQRLMPFDINRAEMHDGSFHFRTEGQPPLDVFISHLNGSVENLSNITGSLNPLQATAQISGRFMDQAPVSLKMRFDPTAYRPTFHLALRLLGLDVTKLNALTRKYGKFDFKTGFFDLVVEADAKNGEIRGYVKPLFRDLQVFSFSEMLAQGDPLKAFWEALIGTVTTVFKNVRRDQFGTVIPFSGDLSTQTTVDLVDTLSNLLRNAFVRAYLPRLQPGFGTEGGFQFAPASEVQPGSEGGTS